MATESLFDDAPVPEGREPHGAALAGAAASSKPGPQPLAEQLRPRTLNDVVGQQHLVGPGRPLREAFEAQRLHSMILWGPPGVGKTTLARLVAHAFDAHFISISAVLGGVKEIRDAVELAQVHQRGGRATIVFVDEVHRFNKGQQDAFLPHVESGLFTFIGATTENPSFEVNAALLSRATVYVLQSIADADMHALLTRAQTLLQAPALTDSARDAITAHADGDARRLLNAYEIAAATASTGQRGAAGETGGGKGHTVIDDAVLERALGTLLRRYDKSGDLFYDAISALHKSVRGSDPDASLYWLARMIDGGAQPRYIARRLVRMASEDIGMADPRALRMTLDATETWERLGSPEGDLALAQAVVYLAMAPKSNAVYKAWGAVRKFVAADGTRPVPMHLRNAPTTLMKKLGHGQGYRYAHDEDDAFAAGERYLPDGVHQTFYEPTSQGLEARIAERLAIFRDRNAAARPAPQKPDRTMPDDAPNPSGG
jgi:putative ATPase